VPANASSVLFAIYSHGDSHPVSKTTPDLESYVSDPMNPVEIKEKMDPLKHEWFAHMPYPSPNDDINT
jgi:hypothetical protein